MKQDRIRVLLIGVVALWAIMALRTFQIQVVEGDEYGGRAESQSQRRMIWKPERGFIVDRDGHLLATNQPVWDSMGMTSQRLYPEGRLACQLLGYTGRDGQGLQGLEYAFDEKLRGIDGWSYQTLDARRRALPGLEHKGRAPTPGLEMVLTINRDDQEIMENALAKGVKELDADRGSAVLMDPNTGEILAMASYPGFDPNNPGDAKGKEIRNDLVSLVYEPGSTFKMVTASAALEEHTVDPNLIFDTEHGRMVLPNGDVIRDTKDHGPLNMVDAFAVSSNITYAKIGRTIGDEKFYRFARAFGFGSPTMIEIPGEESGMLKPVHAWSARTLLTMAFGHEIMATPLQLIVAYCAVANGGELLQPRIIKEWRNPLTGSVVDATKRTVVRRVISQQTSEKLLSMMREVVQRGTAANIKSTMLDFGGKTGTAEKYSQAEGKYDHSSMFSSFIGMVPANNPRFVCMVVVDEPRNAHVGAFTAGPIFKEIMERIYYSPKVSPIQYHLAQVQDANSCESAQYVGLTRVAAETLAHQSACAVSFQGPGTQVMAQTLNIDSSATPSLNLTLGPIDTKQMPNLHGLSLRDALEALGPECVNVQFAGKGRVSEQDPLPNTPLLRGQSLKLVLKERS